MARTYLVFGDIEGKLDVLRVDPVKQVFADALARHPYLNIAPAKHLPPSFPRAGFLHQRVLH